MDNITVRQIFKNTNDYIGKKVRISGWVRSVRDLRNSVSLK